MKMQSQSQNSHIFQQKPTFRDPDVEHLKVIIDRALIPIGPYIQPPHQCREEEFNRTIEKLEGRIQELNLRIEEIQKKYSQSRVELQTEKEMRKQETFKYESRIREIYREKEQETNQKQLKKTIIPEKNMQPSVINQSPSPSRIKHSALFMRTQTPINDLLEFSVHHSSPSRDQIHRLHSYLIENTTTVKLLLEKHKYLIKIREMGHPSPSEEVQLISKTTRALEDRKIQQQAMAVLNFSNKNGLYEEDRSQSDIQNENNGIDQKPQD